MIKQLIWVASSRSDFKEFPDEVQDGMGYALYIAQMGKKHPHAKPLKGFGGAGVQEIVARYDTDTYRAIYTVALSEAVFMLHAFQKKSNRGVATPKLEIEKVHSRLREAQAFNDELRRQREEREKRERGEHNER